MKIYVICMTMNTTDCTVVQVSVLYDIRREGQVPNNQSRGQCDVLNWSHINLDICPSSYKFKAMLIVRARKVPLNSLFSLLT